MSEASRLEGMIEEMGYTISAFAKELGYDRPDRIYQIIRRDSKLSKTFIEDLKKRFPDADVSYLRTGTKNLGNSEGARLKHLAEFLSGSINSFASDIGFERSERLYQIIRMDGNISRKILNAIMERFPRVNQTWLVNGTGQMLNPDKSVPYYDVDVSAGDVTFYMDSLEEPAAKYIMPPFQDCEMAVPVYGDSMYPKYRSGDVILLKRTEIVTYGDVYLVCCGNRNLVKYVRKHEDDRKLLLLSENKKFDPIEIYVSDVEAMYLVKGSISRNEL